MTYRPPMKQKWFYPVILIILVVMGYGVVSVKAPPDMAPMMRSGPVRILILLGLVTSSWTIASWTLWTARVEVDDAGVRWKKGKDSGFLAWQQISSLSVHGINLALIERGSGGRTPLPFASRELYEALKSRLNSLSPEEEEILFRKR